jgi:hypothetical protein
VHKRVHERVVKRVVKRMVERVVKRVVDGELLPAGGLDHLPAATSGFSIGKREGEDRFVPFGRGEESRRRGDVIWQCSRCNTACPLKYIHDTEASQQALHSQQVTSAL